MARFSPIRGKPKTADLTILDVFCSVIKEEKGKRNDEEKETEGRGKVNRGRWYEVAGRWGSEGRGIPKNRDARIWRH